MPGTGSTAGRCSIAASIRVYSLLRTGAGATALSAPESESSQSAR